MSINSKVGVLYYKKASIRVWFFIYVIQSTPFIFF